MSTQSTSSAPALPARRAGRLAALAAAGRRGGEGRSPVRRSSPLALGFGLVMLATVVLVTIDAAAGEAPLLPPSPSMTKWLEGLGETLGFRIFLVCLLVFTLAYVGLIVLARRVSPRVAIALVAALNVVIFVGPVLISTDVFSYIAYARMFVEHGVNPYVHGPRAISGDPIFKYVGTDWLTATSAYGPLYTLISLPAAAFESLIAATWVMKVEALLSSGVACWLTWRCAKQRGLDPVPALLIVGTNPLWLFYALGGNHNDLMMVAFIMAAVTFALAEREIRSGATILAGSFVKATAVTLVPFMILSRRKPREVVGMAIGLVVFLALGFALFGTHGIEILTILEKDSSYVSSEGFPTVFMHLLGKPGVFPVDHIFLFAALAIVVVYLFWRTWRGYDWIAASGWALLAIAVTSPWLLGWYLIWALPLGVIGKDRRLTIVVLVIQGLYIVHQLAPLFSPVST
ncbi:MAG: polyprenol phosphomannose-dependent alpha 1,6 mannosyltransferase MptB [Solirubrobacteraceae bacterium]